MYLRTFNIKKLAFSGILILSCLQSFSQVKRINGSYKMEIGANMTDVEAELIATQRAQAEAIENEFGSIVNAVNFLKLENNNGKSNLNVNSYSNSLVKGVWINNIKLPVIDYPIQNGVRYITVEVAGRARKFEDLGFDLEAIPLDCKNKKCDAAEFKSMDSLYFYFKSPEDGFLSIYVDDQDSVYRLLPYLEMKSSTVAIEGDQEYIFFNNEGPYVNMTKVPHVELYTNYSFEVDFIYVIFSKVDFSKPLLTKEKTTDSDSFQDWISKIVANEQIFMKRIAILINK